MDFTEITNRISLQAGALVGCNGRNYSIVHALDLQTVLAEDLATRERQVLSIAELTVVKQQEDQNKPVFEPELKAVSEEDWAIAQKRFGAIEPLLALKPRTREEVRKRGLETGVHAATLYRWIKDYQRTGRLSALLPTQDSEAKGRTKLDDDIERLLIDTIDEKYLHAQKRSIKKVADEVIIRCKRAGLTPPHPGTVRNRIRQISDQKKLKKRYGIKAADDRYGSAPGHFPNATHPYTVIQIDHTKPNVIIVDDRDRLPIGRPWLTVAIDVFSRVIAGLYLSLDPPGEMSVGLCLSHAILPKEKWLATHGVTEPWPVWGIMGVVHADNGKDFRGDMLKLAANELRFDLEWRPVKQPKFGGHIESLCGTLKEELNELAGSTFVSPKDRENYDSEKEAIMTFSELETWIVKFITQIYHKRKHDGIGMPPLKKLEDGIFGNDDHPAAGLPERPTDERHIRLMLMPYEERTVQQYGIQWDKVNYYADVLRPWINAIEPGTRGKLKRKFIVRRDPRDISVLYFYDPDLRQHFEVPYRNMAHPSISIWELRAAERYLDERGVKDIDEDKLFAAYEELREIEHNAKKETKKARRERQRREQPKTGQVSMLKPKTPTTDDTQLASAASLDYDHVEPYEEIDEI